MLLLHGHTGAVLCARFSADGRMLATCGEDGRVLGFNLAEGGALQQTTEHLGVACLEFVPGRAELATAGVGGMLMLRTSRGWGQARLMQDSRQVNAIAFSPTGRRLALGATDPNGNGYAVDVDVRNHRMSLLEVGIDRAPVAAVAYSPSGPRIAVGAEGFLLQWTPRSDSALLSWTQRIPADRPSRSSIPSIARLHGDGGGEILDVDRHFRSVAYSPDGALLAAAVENEVQLWDTGDARLVDVLEAHRAAVRSVAFSPDGRLLASGGEDEIVVLWDAARRRVATQFEWQVGTIHSLAFAPDGLTAVAAGQDAVVVWDVEEP